MIKLQEIQLALEHYFNGESTDAEEKQLEAYFSSGQVADEVAQYTDFFGGIKELSNTIDDKDIEDEVMSFILEKEKNEKTNHRVMWRTVMGIAASLIIIVGGILFYETQKNSFEDTFNNPDDAYAYASMTLSFVSNKYNEGITELSTFDKLRKANKPVKKGTTHLLEFYRGLEQLNSVVPQNIVPIKDSM